MFPQYVSSVFWTDTDFRKNDIILTILEKTLSYGKPFFVDKMFLDDETRNRFVKFKLDKDYERIKKAINIYDYLVFEFLHEENDYFSLNIARRPYDGKNIYGRLAPPNTCSIEVERHLFRSDEIIEKHISLLKSIYNLISPYYGYSHESNDEHEIYREDEWLKIFHKPNFCMIHWANFFGPSIVENYGGKKIFLDAPCWKVEELNDGGILLLLYPDPLNPEKKEKRKIQNDVLTYFNLLPIDEKQK